MKPIPDHFPVTKIKHYYIVESYNYKALLKEDKFKIHIWQVGWNFLCSSKEDWEVIMKLVEVIHADS